MWRTAALASLAGIALAFASPGATGDRAARDPATHEERAPDGLLLLSVLSPERAMVADPRTGRTTERELPGGTLCHGPLLAAGDRIVFVGHRKGRFAALAAPLRRPGGPAPTSRGDATTASRESVRSLGPAEILTASPAPGLVWLGSRSRSPGGRIALREVDPRGRLTGRRAALPGMSWVQGVIEGGVVLVRGETIELRTPGRRVSLGAGWPLALAGDRLAWCPNGCRRIRVWSGGAIRTFEPPAAIRPEPGDSATFSPDGTRLALAVKARGRSRAAVVDLEQGRWRLVPGARLTGYRAIAWSPSGRWLYFSRGDRVMASRDGSERAVRLPIRTRGTVMAIASVRPASTP